MDSGELQDQWSSGPEVIKKNSCSAHLNMKFLMHISVNITKFSIFQAQISQ